MQVTKKNLTPTKVQLNIVASQDVLDEAKARTLKKFRSQVKIQGFREGKAPLSLVEKQIEPSQLQSEFLEQAINRIYMDAVNQEKVRPVDQPKVNIKKFVPFATLEIEAEVDAVGEIKLADYKKIRLARKDPEVTAKDVNDVIASLMTRAADRQDIDRAAKNGDEVTIDFTGADAKTGEKINGADGKSYPLVLGSDSFIPGFEANLVGMKAGEEKTFDLTFPKDYGVKALLGRKVTFTTTVTKVQQITEPKLDDEFAAKAGPFTSVADLKADIKKQLLTERSTQAQRDYENELVGKLAEKSEVAIPKALIEDEIDRIENDERQNIVYRGQTWEEHLIDEGLTAEEHRERNRPQAEMRVKAGLALSELAAKENIMVTPEELEIRMQLLKGQYKDSQMQAELDKPENRRDIASRILSEKTIEKLASYADPK